MHTIRRMTLSDLDAGMRLKAEAGWNQTEADWRRFLELGDDGCFVAELNGRVVGSVTSCRFGTIAWVAMMLVEKAHRGAGIGRSLLIHCIEHLEAAGATSIRLDATELGRPLYESLGFRVDFHLNRHRGVARGVPLDSDTDTRTFRQADLAAIAQLDRAATATDRTPLLDRLLAENSVNSLMTASKEGTNGGFAFWRPGSAAIQVGPCIAERDDVLPLLEEVGRRLSGREVIVDIPSNHAESVAWANRLGLAPSREFWRMTRGESIVEDRKRLWASSGPEMG